MADQQTSQPLSTETIARMNAWWHAANYLSVGQLYLLANADRAKPPAGRAGR